MNKIIVGTIVGALIIIAGLFALNVDNSDKKIVRIGYLPAVHALPLFVAEERGYFADEGIITQITKFEAPNQIIDALIAGHIDMALAAATGITAIAESQRPNSLKVFAIAGGDKNHIAESIIVKKESQMKEIADLKNKKVGVLPGIQWRTIADNIFSGNGLDIKEDLTLVELAIPLQAQALASGQVDAVLAIEPVITIAESLGISRTLIESPNLQYVSDPFYAGVGNVSVRFINESPKTLEDVLKALERAHEYMSTDLDSAREYLPKYTPLTTELAMKVNLPVYKMYKDFNESDVLALEKFIDVFKEHDVIKVPLSASAMLFDQ